MFAPGMHTITETDVEIRLREVAMNSAYFRRGQLDPRITLLMMTLPKHLPFDAIYHCFCCVLGEAHPQTKYAYLSQHLLHFVYGVDKLTRRPLPDIPAAIFFLLRAAESSHEAALLLADIYENGLGCIAKDTAESLRWRVRHMKLKDSGLPGMSLLYDCFFCFFFFAAYLNCCSFTEAFLNSALILSHTRALLSAHALQLPLD